MSQLLLLLALAAPPVEVHSLSPPTDLAGTWRCTSGDNAAYAQPGFDDDGWEAIRLPSTSSCGEINDVGGRRHVVWLRQTIRVPARFAQEALGISVGDARGVQTVYVDGVELGVRGRLEPLVDAPRVGGAMLIPPGLADDGLLVVAVRLVFHYDVSRALPVRLIPHGPLMLGQMPNVDVQSETELATLVRSETAFSLGFTILMLLVALYHALVWLMRRSLRGYLWFSLFVLLASLWLATVTLESTAFMPFSAYRTLTLGNFIGSLVTVFFIEFFWRYLYTKNPSRLWRVYQGLLVVISLIGFVPDYGIAITVSLPVIVIKLIAMPWALAIFIRVALSKTKRRREARVLVIGVGIATLMGPFEALVDHTEFALPMHPAQAALAGFTITMAIALVRSFTGTLMHVENLNASIARFVPFGFLHALGRDSVDEVERGDSRGAEMTVMFCDIRGFTTLAENLGPDGTFAFLNDYLARMEPHIHAGGGFINQYYGDGLMALFPGDPGGALEAARGMFRALDEMNASRDEPVKIGVALHAGPIWIGTIGGGERLDAGVIGDVVNSTARLEGMTKIYGVPLLVSGELLARVTDRPKTRLLDVVLAKGKSAPLEIHALLEDDDSYRAAFARYQRGEFAGAHAAFSALANDAAAAELADRCRALMDAPPGSWDGVFALTRK